PNALFKDESRNNLQEQDHVDDERERKRQSTKAIDNSEEDSRIQNDSISHNYDDPLNTPLFLRNIEELGNWRKPKVKLRKYNNDTTYWYSEPIRSGSDDNRVLEIQRQKFDIWISNSTYSFNHVADYIFLDVIYES
ncbi:6840_t:CDS:2, partial [Funneliformis mosseae]